MPRTAWLALICLISLGILFGLRSNIGARSVPAEVSLPPADLPIDDGSPHSKSDRLPSPNIDKLAAKPEDNVASPKVPVSDCYPQPD